MTYERNTAEPWTPPPAWGDWVNILEAAHTLGITRYLVAHADIRRRRVGHKTVVVNVSDLVDWWNADVRNRYIANQVAKPETEWVA